MNILVCVKQVPDTTEIKIDPVTNTLIRQGVPSIVNPFDTYALELAVRLKEKNGGEITVVSMGPDQAIAALKECLSVGADKAYLITDRAFGGSDTLATSRVLAAVYKKLGPFDIVFCGKQAIDGDTGQVGPEMAEHLKLTQISNISELEIQDCKVRAQKEFEEGYEIVEAQLPTIVTVTKTPYEPRYSTIKSKLAANRTTVEKITIADLDIEAEKVGLKGSPTKVKKTFTPQAKGGGVVISEDSGMASAKKLCALLVTDKIV